MKIKKIYDKPMNIHQKEKPVVHRYKPKEIKIKEKQMVKKDGKESIKVKEKSIRLAKLGLNKLDQHQDDSTDNEQSLAIKDATRPIVGISSEGAKLYKRKSISNKQKKIKQVEQGKKIAKKTIQKGVKDIAKNIAKNSAKEVAKGVASTVGTVSSGAVGMVASIAVGQKMDEIDSKNNSKARKIRYFIDKIKPIDKSTDSLGKLIKDLIMNKLKFYVKKYTGVLLIGVVGAFLLGAVAIIPVIVPVTMMYNSPFAIFLPSLEEGDTVISLTKEYINVFEQEINDIANKHKGCDEGEIVYVDYEGDSNPTNVADIICVYMVKYGVGDTATIMNEKSKDRLNQVVEGMCSYTTTEEVVRTENEEGTKTEYKVLQVKVTLKSYRDMIKEYNLDEEQQELLLSMINSENIDEILVANGLVDVSSSGGTGDRKSSLSDEEINKILAKIDDSTIKKAVAFALSKVGYPYSQDYRDSGEYYDCSSLVYYSWKAAGKNISYQGVNSAAEEARGLDAKDKTVAYKDIQPGDVIFFSYCKNGRYKNISHVAIYVGDGKVVEAKSKKYGVIYGDVPNVSSIVMVGRP
ncbi:MAG: NlpC/P60 family protein [Lachnospiraceae bacterium]|nr:NlpC/P60 family protein [Lachnospiraceae bacterium]